MDEDGFLFINDRKKDMVIRGGENIACPEVEAAIAEHPDVLEASVFGVPDERLGEILATNVCVRDESKLDETDLNSFLGTKLANFKIPTHVWIQKEKYFIIITPNRYHPLDFHTKLPFFHWLLYFGWIFPDRRLARYRVLRPKRDIPGSLPPPSEGRNPDHCLRL